MLTLPVLFSIASSLLLNLFRLLFPSFNELSFFLGFIIQFIFIIIWYVLFFLVLIIITLWILFTVSLWLVYFGLELQWLCLILLYFIDSSVYFGMVCYLMFGGILSIWLVTGLLTGNSIFNILIVFGKIGYFPFFCMFYIYYCASYYWLIADLINKFGYACCLLVLSSSYLYVIHSSLIVLDIILGF